MVRIVRDDDYCIELLHLLRRLWATVRSGEAPPDDFYLRDDEDGRYARFLERTCRIAEQATVQRHIPQPWRPRRPAAAGRLFVDEFLDEAAAAASERGRSQ